MAKQLGLRLAERVIEADPDLVAIKPLVESASVSLVGSSAFGPVVRKSAGELHAVFTQEEPAMLRLADVGAVLSGVLRQADPSAAARLPSGLDVTLSDIGSQSFASQSLEVVRVVHLLAWLLPVLAILCLRLRLAWRTTAVRPHPRRVGGHRVRSVAGPDRSRRRGLDLAGRHRLSSVRSRWRRGTSCGRRTGGRPRARSSPAPCWQRPSRRIRRSSHAGSRGAAGNGS